MAQDQRQYDRQYVFFSRLFNVFYLAEMTIKTSVWLSMCPRYVFSPPQYHGRVCCMIVALNSPGLTAVLFQSMSTTNTLPILQRRFPANPQQQQEGPADGFDRVCFSDLGERRKAHMPGGESGRFVFLATGLLW